MEIETNEYCGYLFEQMQQTMWLMNFRSGVILHENVLTNRAILVNLIIFLNEETGRDDRLLLMLIRNENIFHAHKRAHMRVMMSLHM